jgi:hypothetical protein
VGEFLALIDAFQAGPDVPGAWAVTGALLFAFFVGQLVAWLYMVTHAGVSYSRAFVQSLVLIAVIVALVMILVGSNLVVAFGLMGALAIIRFRNVLKDTRDTSFIFMELAVGLGAGTWNFVPVAIGTVLLGLILLVFHVTDFGARVPHDALLRFSFEGESARALQDLLRRHCTASQLVSERLAPGRTVRDFSYRLMLRDPDRSDELITELRAVAGVQGVSLLRQQDLSEV